jgi:hypothetical protein
LQTFDNGKYAASASSEWHQLFPLAVESRQFDQLINGWIEESGDGMLRFQLRYVIKSRATLSIIVAIDAERCCDDREGSPRNSYVKETVLCALNGIAGLGEFKSSNSFKRLAEAKMGVHITLQGDNDFYSQVQRVGVMLGREGLAGFGG